MQFTNCHTDYRKANVLTQKMAKYNNNKHAIDTCSVIHCSVGRYQQFYATIHTVKNTAVIGSRYVLWCTDSDSDVERGRKVEAEAGHM